MLKQNCAKNVLVVATHPDDETLGVGGTLLKHLSNGDKVHCIFCTEITIDDGYSQETIKNRQEEIKQVSDAYNFSSVHFLGLKTTKVDTYTKSDLIEKFSKIFNAIQPNIIYLPFMYDVHSDHRIIFEAAFSCTKSFRYPSIERILMMETLSETEFAPNIATQSFIPNVFVDITDFIEKKCEIMKIYKSEISAAPFPRSLENIKALAILRGCTLGGGEGIKYAESFMLLKERI